MLIGGKLGYRMLRWLKPPSKMRRQQGQSEPGETSKLTDYWGEGIWEQLAGKRVIDFGCGPGIEAVEIARHGAKAVIGIDILERYLKAARAAARRAGVSEVCSFVRSTTEKADVILSTDAFEHFGDPGGILQTMAGLLEPGGVVLITFGPPWYHPKGGHVFSVFPWAHLLFTERCLLRWRSDFKTDGAARFCEIDGGLNQMSVRRFKALVAGGLPASILAGKRRSRQFFTKPWRQP